jgi:hypothetical protein
MYLFMPNQIEPIKNQRNTVIQGQESTNCGNKFNALISYGGNHECIEQPEIRIC